MKSVISAFVISILHFVIGLWLSSKSHGSVVSAVNTGRELTFVEKICRRDAIFPNSNDIC